MRYDDWDVLLFPGDSKIPMKEFRVGCHVINDHEFGQQPGHYGLLPVMTCFIPSLPAGEPFSISCHSWQTPMISPQSRSYTRHPQLIKFEARVFIDGALVASAIFDKEGGWPHVINSSFHFSKNGELNSLTFPAFDERIVRQSYWSAADTWGRIKLVISEGFIDDTALLPGIQRVKNIVAFSFQHAPLHILEAASIAWPCPSMWRCTPLTTISPVPTQRPEEGPESHLHSPRRRVTSGRSQHAGMAAAGTMSGVLQDIPRVSAPPCDRLDPYVSSLKTSALNPIGSSALDWGNHPNKQDGPGVGGGYGGGTGFSAAAQGMWRRQTSLATSGDLSMPDYTSSQSGHATKPLQGDATFERNVKSDLRLPCRVPTNTPTGSDGGGLTAGASYSRSYIDTELAASLFNAFRDRPMGPWSNSNQKDSKVPALEVTSRKENQPGPSSSRLSAAAGASTMHDKAQLREMSQQILGVLGTGTTRARVPTNENLNPQGLGLTDRTTSMGSLGRSRQHSGTGLDGMVARGGRNFTPASMRAIDSEDEPRRCSRVPSLATRVSVIE